MNIPDLIKTFLISLAFDLMVCGVIAYFTVNQPDFILTTFGLWVALTLARLIVTIRKALLAIVLVKAFKSKLVSQMSQEMRKSELPKDNIYAMSFDDYYNQVVVLEELPRKAVIALAETRGNIAGITSQSFIFGLMRSAEMNKAVQEYLK